MGFSGSVGFVSSVASVASVGLVTSEAWVEPVVSGGSVCGTVVSGGTVISAAPVVSVAAGIVAADNETPRLMFDVYVNERSFAAAFCRAVEGVFQNVGNHGYKGRRGDGQIRLCRCTNFHRDVLAFCFLMSFGFLKVNHLLRE